MKHPLFPRLRSDFRRDTQGVSAVEFALILPIMLSLFVGISELAHAIDNSRKVTLLTRTLADLTSQGDTTNPIASATMGDIFSAASLVLAPFNSANATIKVSAMGVYLTTLNTRPYVCSSAALNATARTAKAAATDITVPTAFQTTGMRYILAEVTMPYTPMLGAALVQLFTGTTSITFSATMPWPVRGGTTYNSTYAEIILPNGISCPTTAS
ncbi:pilus assembly protein [Methylobacterium sp. BTF04]|uniref:TadE/TadG family type IV pilus assembly protein n=1 Tax=Methylobacterium sp. BTF04 TaxID=2708300 RepID=UPI0013D2CC66|nr:TadE/TadG family type IV pilus assembly protein [Methylobacterium sp. BTF04]NEU11224.1 pilus assembly protein [Methylobacterium sp. BTF04]